MFVPFESLPVHFRYCVRNQKALLCIGYSFHEGALVIHESKWGFPRRCLGRWTHSLAQSEPVGTAFRNQDPRAGVGHDLGKRLQESVHNIAHTEILGDCQCRFAERLLFCPCRFR